MSGICGVWAFDGGGPDLRPVLASLERRGPDATNEWSDGPVALGHTLLATTPEALVEVLPLTEADSGCTITADARIDNRDELVAALGLGGETRTIGDGELILRAYLRWGDDCPTHLLGDFAFAIWDPRAHHLFCARDHMGMRQLIYHHAPGGLFAFATEAEALVAHSAVPKRINEGRIADFLDDLEGIDFTSTFFENVSRLPPAHSLTVGARLLSLRRFWELAPGPELKLHSDQAYADAFLDVFTEAVQCRLRSAGSVGSMLSGGMDSGSIVAIAARKLMAEGKAPLQTFSAIGPNKEICEETRAIAESAKMAGLKTLTVDFSELEEFQSTMELLTLSAEPFDSEMSLIHAVYSLAQREGMNIMLDGVAGDVVLVAANRVVALLRQGRFAAAFREARGEVRFWGTSWPLWKSLMSATWVAFAPRFARRIRRRIVWKIQDARKQRLIAPDFGARINLAGRRQQYRSYLSYDKFPDTQRRARSIAHPHLAVARERYDRIAASLAIEPRDPFMDLRVVQFCLGLPEEQLQSGGWQKIIQRRAMVGLMPESVIWRLGKSDLGREFTFAHFSGRGEWMKQFDEGKKASIARYANITDLEAGNTCGTSPLDNTAHFKLFFLANWLKEVVTDKRW